jgi:hypothetical protein
MAGPKPKNTAAKADEAIVKGDGVVVVGPAKGRWRIGRHFGPSETHIPAAELSQEMVTALQADPSLFVFVRGAPATVASDPAVPLAPDLPAPDLPDPAST